MGYGIAVLSAFALLHAAGAAPGGTPRFTDVTNATTIRLNAERRPQQPAYGTQCPHGVVVEVFDGDGRFDILVVCFGEPHVRLFRNLGGFRFADTTEGSGLQSFQGMGSGPGCGSTPCRQAGGR